MVVAPANVSNAALVDDVVAMMARIRDAGCAHFGRSHAPRLHRYALSHSVPTLLVRLETRHASPRKRPSGNGGANSRSRLVVVPDSGHMVAMEQPGQATGRDAGWFIMSEEIRFFLWTAPVRQGV